MNRLSQMAFALRIIKRYSKPPSQFEGLSDEQLSFRCREIIDNARDLLQVRIGRLLDQLDTLGFSIKYISSKIGFDDPEVSRAHNRHKLSMSLDKMGLMMEKLVEFLPEARYERMLLAASSARLQPIEYCWSGGVTQDQEREIVRVVRENLIAKLCSKPGRQHLPAPFKGVILDCGSATDPTWIIHWEGETEIEQRVNRLHELKHLVEREEAELENLRSKETANANQKPRQRTARF